MKTHDQQKSRNNSEKIREKKKFGVFTNSVAEHMFFLKRNLQTRKIECFVVGNNNNFQCCVDSETKIIKIPTKVTSIKGCIKSIACGSKGTLILTELRKGENCIFGVGNNEDWSLSLPKKEKYKSPVLVNSLQLKNQRISAISLCNSHSVFLSEKGAFSSGLNQAGECGQGNYKQVKEAKEIKIDHKVIDISTGLWCTLLLTETLKVFKSGKVFLATRTSVPIELVVGEEIISFSAGGFHVLLLGKSNTVYGYGNDNFFQIRNTMGPSSAPNDIVKVQEISKQNVIDLKCSIYCSYYLVEMNNGKMGVFAAGKKNFLGLSIDGGIYQHQAILIKDNVQQIETGALFACFINQMNDLSINGTVVQKNWDINDNKLFEKYSKNIFQFEYKSFPKYINCKKFYDIKILTY